MEDHDHMSWKQKIALEGENMDSEVQEVPLPEVQEVSLPEGILHSFEKIDMVIQGKTDGQGRTRKGKVWGPVQATRESSRVDRSMNVMKRRLWSTRGGLI
jgi:hypothetical protein